MMLKIIRTLHCKGANIIIIASCIMTALYYTAQHYLYIKFSRSSRFIIGAQDMEGLGTRYVDYVSTVPFVEFDVIGGNDTIGITGFFPHDDFTETTYVRRSTWSCGVILSRWIVLQCFINEGSSFQKVENSLKKETTVTKKSVFSYLSGVLFFRKSLLN